MSARALTAVWEFTQAKGTQLAIFLKIADWATDDGICPVSFRELAVKSRCTRRNAIRCVQQLMEWGELKRLTPDKIEGHESVRGAYVRWQRTNRYRIRLVDQLAQQGRSQVVTLASPLKSAGGDAGDRKVVTPRAASKYLHRSTSSKSSTSSAARRRRLPDPVENAGTYNQLQRVAHDLLDVEGFARMADFTEGLKLRLGQLQIFYDPETLARAIASVLVVRGYDGYNAAARSAK